MTREGKKKKKKVRKIKSKGNFPRCGYPFFFFFLFDVKSFYTSDINIVQELCESRGGRPGLSVLTSLPVSVDVKLY